eukprot:9235333-Alexandrium_andersonii.AAC.1
MLDGMRAPDAHPSARGTPSAQAPSKVGVRIKSEGNPFRLAKENGRRTAGARSGTASTWPAPPSPWWR